MDIEQFSKFVALMGALSAASERLVELIKDVLYSDLGESKPTDKDEAHRRAKVVAMSIACGVFTAVLAGQVVDVPQPAAVEGGLWPSFEANPGAWTKHLLRLEPVMDLRCSATVVYADGHDPEAVPDGCHG